MKISYKKLEEILTEVGYSNEKLDSFRKEFVDNFLAKLGSKVQTQLTPDQKQQLFNIASVASPNIDRISAYLKTLNLESQIKQNIEVTLNETLNYTLEQMVKNSSQKEAIIINKVLSIN